MDRHVKGHHNPHGLKDGDRYYIDEATQHAKPINRHPHGNHPFFRVIRLPNCTVEQLSHLVHEEVAVDSRRPSPYLQYRSHHIDLGKITKAKHGKLHDHWHDDDRTDQHLTLDYTWDQLQAIISQRKPVPF